MAVSQHEPAHHVQRIVLLLAVLLVAGAGALWLRAHGQKAPVSAVATAAPATVPAAATHAREAPVPPLPDDRLRALLESVSSNPLYRKWIAQGDVLHRWAVVTDNIAEDVTPRRQLSFLAPEEQFSTVTDGAREVIAAKSYQRYDAVAAAIGSIDAAAFARVVRDVHPALEAVYRALGYPGASLDEVVARALQRIEQSPVEVGPVVVEKKISRWIYTDPRLEGLGAVEKHLLRMGPRNERLVQEKAHQISRALGPT
jgi:hypothetical protein